MTDTIQKRLEEMQATINAATPAPFFGRSEYVNTERGGKELFWVLYSGERSGGYSGKLPGALFRIHGDTKLFMQSRTDWERTVKALQVAVERLQKYCKCWDTKLCSDCKTLEKIEEILGA